jgi:hypothetical protein
MIAFSMPTICAVMVALMYDDSDESLLHPRACKRLKEPLRLLHYDVA